MLTGRPLTVSGLSAVRSGRTILHPTSLEIAPGALPGEVYVVQLEELNRPQPEELDTLAIVSGVQLTQTLTQDLQQAFQVELQGALEVESNAAALAAYRPDSSFS